MQHGSRLAITSTSHGAKISLCPSLKRGLISANDATVKGSKRKITSRSLIGGSGPFDLTHDVATRPVNAGIGAPRSNLGSGVAALRNKTGNPTSFLRWLFLTVFVVGAGQRSLAPVLARQRQLTGQTVDRITTQ